MVQMREILDLKVVEIVIIFLGVNVPKQELARVKFRMEILFVKIWSVLMKMGMKEQMGKVGVFMMG